MTDMNNWTEAEKTEYLIMLNRIARSDNPTPKELVEMSKHGKEAMVEIYREMLLHPPKRTWFQSLLRWLK